MSRPTMALFQAVLDRLVAIEARLAAPPGPAVVDGRIDCGEPGGIPCPKCHRDDCTTVLETRARDGVVRRRRECLCGARFVTEEKFAHEVAARSHRGVTRRPAFGRTTKSNGAHHDA